MGSKLTEAALAGQEAGRAHQILCGQPGTSERKEQGLGRRGNGVTVAVGLKIGK